MDEDEKKLKTGAIDEELLLIFKSIQNYNQRIINLEKIFEKSNCTIKPINERIPFFKDSTLQIIKARWMKLNSVASVSDYVYNVNFFVFLKLYSKEFFLYTVKSPMNSEKQLALNENLLIGIKEAIDNKFGNYKDNNLKVIYQSLNVKLKQVTNHLNYLKDLKEIYFLKSF